ncbi:MAG: tetratricopeptide repeat protein [Treponema sp.]
MPTHRGIRNILKPVFDRLKEGNVETSYSLVVEILENNLDNEDVNCAYTAIFFWKEKLGLSTTYSSPFESGEYIFSQWDIFLDYMKKYGDKYEFVIYALKCCMFNIIIDFYTQALQLKGVQNKSQIYRKIGLCHKILGNYEKAVEFLQYTVSLDTSSCVLAELADSHAMCGDERIAKVFFREAFFKDAYGVEIDYLESDIICVVINKLKLMGFKGKELLAWVPVYEVLGGLFNVKRPLKAVEVGKLKQEIFLLENICKDKGKPEAKLAEPRLINCYFWLIDYYAADVSTHDKIAEVLLRLKLLNKEVYKSYIR